ncbi:hypothetical protein RBH29_01675 [Herbivorax sp. ANBcel31]|uniref:hypothetical protein n=1 Tax=Herbivorax sp. ANBcel31 TaxID=3069754 RepID=UPI0027B773EC|nr:hypothetical protein [Herbivorax sp. ANBcel31]MDQ2085144.1 hypothetical protein [Herbivorax sp. ANBcel31]
MEKWRAFENSCVDFLNCTYGSSDLKFIGTGQSDSTNSDIKVVKNGKSLFNIESKMPKSQSGQFVLLNNDYKFIFSTKNKSNKNEFIDLIVNYINSNYETFKNVSTNSIPINLPTFIFENWIKGYYKNKDVRFLISSGRHSDFVIFPINKYGDYFEITGDFRVKKSGSRNLPKKYDGEIKEIFEKNFSPCTILREEKKAYLVTDYILPDKTKIQGNDYKFQFNEHGNKYLVRTLSNTNNANVIFSIQLKKEQDEKDLNEFLNAIK